MGKQKNDIERYLNGEMTPSEMHALEKQALQDPFLSEALEGIGNAGADNFLFDLKELHKSVQHRTRPSKTKVISIWNWSIGIAAGLLLIAASSVYVISIIISQDKQKTLALQEKSLTPSSKNEQDKASNDSTLSLDEKNKQLSLNSPVEKEQAQKPVPKRKRSQQPDVNPTAGATASNDNVENTLENTRETQPVVADDQPKPEVPSAETSDLKKAPSRESSETAKTLPSLASGTSVQLDNRSQDLANNIKIVKGKVISAEDGTALPGVNVLVKGTNTGVVTDAEGAYEISLTDPKQDLVFSFIGLKSVEVKPETKPEVNVQMAPDYAQLSEVVVTGASGDIRADNTPTLEFAQPQGGKKAFQNYLEEKMNYPSQALENKVEGKVTVQFTVAPNGELRDFKILNGIGFGCDDEVIRLIKEGPAWSPTKRNAQPVTDRVKVRLKFDIPN
jgi:TonB family protein